MNKYGSEAKMFPPQLNHPEARFSPARSGTRAWFRRGSRETLSVVRAQ
jgi:hypothetical protein